QAKSMETVGGKYHAVNGLLSDASHVPPDFLVGGHVQEDGGIVRSPVKDATAVRRKVYAKDLSVVCVKLADLLSGGYVPEADGVVLGRPTAARNGVTAVARIRNTVRIPGVPQELPHLADLLRRLALLDQFQAIEPGRSRDSAKASRTDRDGSLSLVRCLEPEGDSSPFRVSRMVFSLGED